MALITADTFNPLLTRCNVRMQQGVPIVDADINELDDIRKFELRAFLKWFVGDGVPDGNDGFVVVGGGLADDFTVQAATTPGGGIGVAPGGSSNVDKGLRFTGRCIVDGLDVIIEQDTLFSAQSLHPSQAGAAAEATRLGTTVIDATPLTGHAAGTVTVYLDVWERLVSPAEDPSLVLAGLGTESCARLERRWVARVASGSSAPAPAAGHSHYVLASINRQTGVATVNAGDVIDRRERRLLVPPSTLINDVLGVNPLEYRRGNGRPIISLRDAINALLRGDLPGTAEAAIAPDPSQDFMSYALTFNAFTGAASAIWHSNRAGGGTSFQVFGSSWDPASPAAGFATPPVQLTAGPAVHALPHAVTLPNGELIVAYESTTAGATSIAFKRGASLGALAGASETPVVAGTAANLKRHPFAVVSGTLAAGGFVVFFWHQATPSPRWMFRRRQYTSAWSEATASWVAGDGAGVEVSSAAAPPSPVTEAGGFHASADAAGDVWIAFSTPTGNDIQAVRMTPSTGALSSPPATLSSSGGSLDLDPFVLIEGNTAVWVFWRSGDGVASQRFLRAGGVWEATATVIPGTNVGATRASPSAVLDATGAIWVFWVTDGGGGGVNHVFAVRRDPATQSWVPIRRMTGVAFNDLKTFSALAPNGAVWLLFTRNLGAGNQDLFFKQIITAV